MYTFCQHSLIFQACLCKFYFCFTYFLITFKKMYFKFVTYAFMSQKNDIVGLYHIQFEYMESCIIFYQNDGNGTRHVGLVTHNQFDQKVALPYTHGGVWGREDHRFLTIFYQYTISAEKKSSPYTIFPTHVQSKYHLSCPWPVRILQKWK